MAFTTARRNAMLDHSFGSVDDTPEVTHWIGWSTTEPTDAGANITEPSVGSYARFAITNNDTNWPNAAGGVKSNGTVFTFVESTAAQGTAGWFVLFDAVTAGNAVAWGALGETIPVGNNFTLNFPIGSIDLTRSTPA